MISVATWLFYFHVLTTQNVIGVRIFQNVLPVPVPKKYVPYEAHVLLKTCMLKPQKGPCRGDIRMYYFDPAISNCSTFYWGGCQGNGNRFDSETECVDHCLSKQGGPKRRPTWCSLTFDYGFCFGAVERYYFDNLWKICKKTIYSGCGGNKNNFYNKEQCESVCLFANGPIKTRSQDDDTGVQKVLIVNPETTKPRIARMNAEDETTTASTADATTQPSD